MRICIVSPEALNPAGRSDVAVAMCALAETLSGDGHDVTTLQSGALRATPAAYVSPTVYDQDAIAQSYSVYEELKRGQFDLIHFVDRGGAGYFATLAKAQGLHFQKTLLAVTLLAPSLWERLGNAQTVDDISHLVRNRLERGTAERCDLVISPSRFMIEHLRQQGWSLPERQAVLPSLLPGERPAPFSEPQTTTDRSLREVVFFGRLEPRDGLLIFCDAIDRIHDRLPPETGICFLGDFGAEYPPESLAARTARWGRKVTFLPGLDRFQSLDYLAQNGCLAVHAALTDNLPCAVLDCLRQRIPFIATWVGGIPEAIAVADRERVLCPATPHGLAAQLVAALERPFAPARLAFDVDETRRAHLRLHEELDRERLTRSQEPTVLAEQPLVSVNLLHHERPDGLRRAIASLERQSYPKIEIVVVDNGSRSAAALACLDALESAGHPRLKVVRLSENLYEPAARNAGVEAASGKYVLFMDDDNVAKPQEVEVFCKAAEHGAADLLTCFADHFATEEPPGSDADALRRFIVMGDFGPLGLLANSYGDLNCFCRRDRFLEIGGFEVDGRFNHAEDWRFFAKAWARGLTLQVVPEALVWYRTSGADWQQGWRKRDRGGALLRAAQAYLETAPPEVAPFLHLAQGLFWQAVGAETERRTANSEREALVHENERLRETMAQLQAGNELLLRSYRALADFIGTTVKPPLEETPELQRALQHIRQISRKYLQ